MFEFIACSLKFERRNEVYRGLAFENSLWVLYAKNIYVEFLGLFAVVSGQVDLPGW